MVSAVKKVFYRSTREWYIEKLRREVKNQDWTKAIHTIKNILGKKEVFEPHIECKILDSMNISVTEDYVGFYIDLLSLNFSQKRLECLKGKIIEEKKKRS